MYGIGTIDVEFSLDVYKRPAVTLERISSKYNPEAIGNREHGRKNDITTMAETITRRESA